MRKQYELKSLKKRESKIKSDESATKVPISLRVDGSDLADIREEAERLGMPYQTLIASILHQYVTDQLVERKTVEMLKKLKAVAG